MHLIVLHPPKGVGESILARELAVAADRARVRVALADLDPQAASNRLVSAQAGQDAAPGGIQRDRRHSAAGASPTLIGW